MIKTIPIAMINSHTDHFKKKKNSHTDQFNYIYIYIISIRSHNFFIFIFLRNVLDHIIEEDEYYYI